ncbi:MAG: LuxR C-terminal-related transcriptional regulator [Planctomycetota bacterium]
MVQTAQLAFDVNRFGPPVFYFANDIQNRITFLSHSVERVLGFSADKHIGQDATSFLVRDHEVNASAVVEHIERFKSSKTMRGSRAVADHRGKPRILAIQTYGERNSEGEIVESKGCAWDITDCYARRDEIRRLAEDYRRRLAPLSERERLVLDLISLGKLNKQIANRLSVSIRTVELIRVRIQKALKVDHLNRALAIHARSEMLELLLDNGAAEDCCDCEEKETGWRPCPANALPWEYAEHKV